MQLDEKVRLLRQEPVRIRGKFRMSVSPLTVGDTVENMERILWDSERGVECLGATIL